MQTATLIIATLLAGPGADNKTVDFVGFSRDESAAAWKVTIQRWQAGGTLDQFSLIHLVDVEDNSILTTFRGSRIVRKKNGKRVRAGTNALSHANPDWAAAATRASWKRVKRAGRFSFKPLKIYDSTLRFLPDPDLHMDMERTRESINAIGQMGEAVGYHPIMRTLGGEQLPLGHFREEGQPGTRIRAWVVAFHSKTGMTVAVLNRFSTTDDDTPVWRSRIVMLDEPAGTTDIGAMRLSLSALQYAQRDYLGNGEKYSKLYTRYVGKRW